MLIKITAILIFTAYAYGQQLAFEHLFLEDGLSQSYVSDINQDIFGYLWIATHDGLNRYDGYNFKIFRHDPDDPSSLKGNWINKIFADSHGRIWIKLGIGGINVYSPETNKFTYLSSTNDKTGLVHQTFNHIFEGPKGHIITSTLSGINIIEAPNNRFSVKTLQLENPGSEEQFYGFLKSVADNHEGLWSLTTNGELIRFNLSEESFGQHQSYLRKKNKIKTVHRSSDGRIWAGGENGRLTVFEVNSSTNINHRIMYQTPDSSAILGILSNNENNVCIITKSNYVYKVLSGKAEFFTNFTSQIKRAFFSDQNNLWITTSANTISHINFYSGKKQTYNAGQIHPKLESYGFLTDIFLDNSQNIWLGTSRLGLQKLSINKARFLHYLEGLDNSFVTSFSERNDGQVYIGTYGGGLHLFNPKSKTIKKLPNSPPSVTALKGGEKDFLYIGTATGKLFLYNIRNNKYKEIDLETSMTIRVIYEAYPDLYLGIDGNGLYRYNLKKQSLKKYPLNDLSGKGTSSIFVWTILKANSKQLWLGLAASGLNMLDPEKETFSYFLPDPEKEGTLNNRTVTALYFDQHKKLWVGTYSGGLNIFDPVNEQFSAITSKDGISGNMICSIVPDKNGKLWMSTNNGVSRLDPQTQEILVYNMGDGLQSNEFYPGAALRTKSGHIYMGGINGFNVFHPDSINYNPNPPKILITDFIIQGNHDSDNSEIINLPLQGGEQINLEYTENYISFEFTATDYTYPQKNSYAYRLKPIDKNWIYTNNRRFASYSSLDPGRYILEIKASNNDGVWNEKGISVKINIDPPFWKTAWFYIIVIMGITLSAVALHRRRIRQKLKRTLEIERIREEEQTKIRSKTARDFHDEMGHRLTRITMLTQLIKRKEKGTNKEFRHLLDQISENANNLYLGARDFIWAIDPRNDSFYEMAIRLKDFGDELFDSTNTDFRLKGLDEKLEDINLSMELRRQIPLIFKEGMTNILKHAHAKNVLLSFNFNSDQCEVVLEDDGNGFDLKKESKGYGLQNMHTRAEKVNLILKLTSSPNKGTRLECKLKFTHNGVLPASESNSININTHN